MGWVRFDDRAIDHPKFLALSASAFRLWFEGMTYCNRHLTDGVISGLALKGFRYVNKARITELVEQRLWNLQTDGFFVHDYFDWNDDRATVLENREKARQRSSGARTRERSPNVPSGVERSGTSQNLEKEKDLAEFEEFWAAYPKRVGKDDALKAWKNAKVSTAVVLAALIRQMPWLQRDEGKYIPNPGTWLRQGRWKDDPPMNGIEGWVCPHDPPCTDGATQCSLRQRLGRVNL